MTMKGKRFESIQDIKAATTVQLKTLTKHWQKRTSRTASESGKKDGISVFEARGSILRGINGNVSCTVVNFFYLNIHHIFWSHLIPLEQFLHFLSIFPLKRVRTTFSQDLLTA